MARPDAATFFPASATEARDTSTDVISACGLFWARVIVCAPTPQPASRTRLPAGYEVSECKQLDQGGGLILQAPALSGIIAVNICAIHAAHFRCWIVLILAANCGGSERALPPGCKLSDMLADITGLFHRPQSECPGKPFIATPSCRCPMRAACNAWHQAGRLFFGLMAARFLRLSCFRPRGGDYPPPLDGLFWPTLIPEMSAISRIRASCCVHSGDKMHPQLQRPYPLNALPEKKVPGRTYLGIQFNFVPV